MLVEDNDVFREALELMLGMREEVEVVAGVADGAAAVETVLEHRPDVVLVDYRLPGIDGAETTKQLLARLPGLGVVALTASADDEPARRAPRGGRVGLSEQDQELDEIVAAIEAGLGMNLTAANTAIVLDSTADLPDAAERFPNWRVVPLYVRFGEESFKDGVEISRGRLLRAPPDRPGVPAHVAADAGRLPPLLRRADRVRADLLAPPLGEGLGDVRERRERGRELGHGVVHAIDTETASASIAMLALAIQRRLERGTTDEEIEALIDRYKRERGLLFTVDTLEFLQRGGRIGKAAAFAGGLLHVKPILSIVDGEVAPVKRVRGEKKAFAELVAAIETETTDEPGWRFAVAHAAAPGACRRARGAHPRAPAERRARARRHAGRSDRRARRSGHRSASSGSATTRADVRTGGDTDSARCRRR